jgi:hypothetical protein
MADGKWEWRMGADVGTTIDYCEHDELRVACLECLAMPKKVTPQPSAAPRATKNPTSEFDKISPLGGAFDMSIPVDSIEPLLGSDWLIAHAFPHYLRRSGWIYLRTDRRLTARVKAQKVVWASERKVPTTEAFEDLGPGMVIKVDARTWDPTIDIDLGAHADRQLHGYRYLKSNEDGTVTHYRGSRPVGESGAYSDGVTFD